MSDRIEILKTYKLFIDGKFPRSESGRSMEIRVKGPRAESPSHDRAVHLCRASRKDLRDAVEAARRGQAGWAKATAYLRGQILYRIAEMVEGKRRELAEAIASTEPRAQARGGRARSRNSITPDAEVTLAVDRLVHYAGWADKYAQVLGCNNPVAGPFYNFTVPEATGVVAVVCPDERPLLGLVSALAPALVPGNAAVVIASTANPIPAAIFAEACATGDVPGGVVNILTGDRSELLPHVATHRDIDAVVAVNLSAAEGAVLRKGVAENLKRVSIHEGVDLADAKACEHPWWIEPLVEMKTMWHPASA
jgi:acyl-CoA reductase-like NAD-dependent aldehyde dehydrogenase